ncbi:MAG: hypothetical protein RL651_576 [Pseudomonadota bacterium]|jgi:hypothetical protein
MSLLTLIVSIRGLLELVLWLLIGRTVLVVLAGRYGSDNPVIRTFDFLLKPVRACSDSLMPALTGKVKDAVMFILLLLIWLGLGVAKLTLVAG